MNLVDHRAQSEWSADPQVPKAAQGPTRLQFIVEIYACDEMSQEAAREDKDKQVWRLHQATFHLERLWPR